MRCYLHENVIFLSKNVNKTFSNFNIHDSSCKILHACLISIQAIHKHFFQFNIIAFQFIIFLFFCLWKWHSRNFLFYFVYTMLVFVGLKKLWIWEKSSSHCTCYFGTATCSLHISLLRFFSYFVFYFFSLYQPCCCYVDMLKLLSARCVL